MTELAKALNSFWSSFGIPAYIEENVPEEAQLPYITYTLVEPDWRDTVTHQARVWYRTNSVAVINQKLDEIRFAISSAGKMVRSDSGFLWLKRGKPFIQFQPYDADPNIKVGYINIELDVFLK